MFDADDIKRRFPSDRYYPGQEKTIEDVVDRFNDGYKYVELSAPPGSGKSPINMTFCREHGMAIYTTPLVMLVNQIRDDKLINGMTKIVYGRRNYMCRWAGEKMDLRTCADGYCQISRGKKKECEYYNERTCEYLKAKDEAMNATVATMTFSYLLAERKAEDVFSDRTFVVIDESQNMDKFLLKFFAIGVGKKSLPNHLSAFPKVGWTMEDVAGWLGKVSDLAGNEIVETKMEHDVEDMEVDVVRRLKYLEGLRQRITWFKEDYEKENEWVYQFEGGPDKKLRIVLEPVLIDRFMQDILWDKYDYFILSSATPPSLQKVGLIDYTDEVGEVEVDSYFPVENNLIVDATNGVGRMSKDHIVKNTPKAIARVKEILDREKEHKGIIHVYSYDQRKDVLGGLGYPDNKRILSHTNEDRNTALDEWLCTNGNEVFVAVEMREGLNLIDDACRFQILYKAPFQDMSNNRIRRLFELGYTDMYNKTALDQIIQENGRDIRGPDDWGTFYVVDRSAMSLMFRYGEDMPKWFRRIFDNRKRWSALQ